MFNPLKFSLFLMIFAFSINSVNFVQSLNQNSQTIKSLVGEKKYRDIVQFAHQKKIVRITEILLIPKIGFGTVVSLEKIMGTRFEG